MKPDAILKEWEPDEHVNYVAHRIGAEICERLDAILAALKPTDLYSPAASSLESAFRTRLLIRAEAAEARVRDLEAALVGHGRHCDNHAKRIAELEQERTRYWHTSAGVSGERIRELEAALYAQSIALERLRWEKR